MTTQETLGPLGSGFAGDPFPSLKPNLDSATEQLFKCCSFRARGLFRNAIDAELIAVTLFDKPSELDSGYELEYIHRTLKGLSAEELSLGKVISRYHTREDVVFASVESMEEQKSEKKRIVC